MTRPTRFCRVAWIVDDMDATTEQLKNLLGLGMRFGNIATDVIKAGIEEHGLEPIQLFVSADDLPFMKGLPYPLVERSEEHTSELQSLMRISYAVFCLKKNNYLMQEYQLDH